jgi:predicted RNase H-like HicB family nuclease
MSHILYRVETELEADGRWSAEIVDVPGAMAYGATEKEAVALARALTRGLATQYRRAVPRRGTAPV